MANKPKYPDEMLLDILKQYTNKNPHKTIRPTELERETGIPRHIWKDNKRIKEVINKLNETPIIANPENLNFTLPNAKQLVDANYNSKPKLIKAIQDCFDIISDLYDKALIGSKTEEREKDFKDKISELHAQLREKDLEIVRLNREIDLIYLESESPTKRNSKGIKDNLIKLDADKIKSISKNIADIEEEYKGLFD